MKSKNTVIQDYLVKNFDRIFDSSINAKKTLLTDIRNFANNKKREEYSLLLELFDMIGSNGSDCQLLFSNIINYDFYNKIKMYINEYLDKSKNKEISYLDHGTTSYVFKIGDYVMKLGNKRYCPNSIRHFRLIKNKREIVYNDNKLALIIEFQKYLKTDKAIINDEMIYQLFIDLRNSDYEVTDPLVLKYNCNNFRLLDNYEDADIDDLSKLSSSFKKYPLVLIDNDLVYKTSDTNKQYFQFDYRCGNNTMEEAIIRYEENQAFLKKREFTR
jgi:hypothetical protein